MADNLVLKSPLCVKLDCRIFSHSDDSAQSVDGDGYFFVSFFYSFFSLLYFCG